MRLHRLCGEIEKAIFGRGQPFASISSISSLSSLHRL
jgi:hypothetical protein